MRFKPVSLGLLTTFTFAANSALGAAVNSIYTRDVEVAHAPDVLELAKIGIFADEGCKQEVDLMSLQGGLCYPVPKNDNGGEGKEMYTKVLWMDGERVVGYGVRASRDPDCTDGWHYLTHPSSSLFECIPLTDISALHVQPKSPNLLPQPLRAALAAKGMLANTNIDTDVDQANDTTEFDIATIPIIPPLFNTTLGSQDSQGGDCDSWWLPALAVTTYLAEAGPGCDSRYMAGVQFWGKKGCQDILYANRVSWARTSWDPVQVRDSDVKKTAGKMCNAAYTQYTVTKDVCWSVMQGYDRAILLKYVFPVKC